MASPQLDDKLIVRVGSGDPDAFRDLYAETSSIVFGYAMSIVKNMADAEDVMHDAFIKVYQGAPSYQPLGKPLAWMLTIVKNLAYNKLRQRKPLVDIGECEDIGDLSMVTDSLDRIVLEVAMGVLDSEERQIVALHALADLKHREIAQILQIPLGTVTSKYRRALTKLRREIEGEAR